METLMPEVMEYTIEEFTVVDGGVIGGNCLGSINAPDNDSAKPNVLVRDIEAYMSRVDPDAPSACIDGRTCNETMSGKPSEPRASVAGGALVTAYAANVLTGYYGPNDARTTAERLIDLGNSLLFPKQQSGREVKIISGGHVDQGAVDNDFETPNSGSQRTGCGATDYLPEILDIIYGHSEEVARITSALLGEQYNASLMSFVPQSAAAKQTTDWKPKVVVDTQLGLGGNGTVEILESGQSLPNYGHAEAAVVVNRAEDTTLNRDAFNNRPSADESNAVQVFALDMWYLDRMAKQLVGGPANLEQEYQRLKHAMAAYQAATYIKLCDGTQRIIVVDR